MPCGNGTWATGPTAAICALSTTTTALCITGLPVPSNTRCARIAHFTVLSFSLFPGPFPRAHRRQVKERAPRPPPFMKGGWEGFLKSPRGKSPLAPLFQRGERQQIRPLDAYPAPMLPEGEGTMDWTPLAACARGMDQVRSSSSMRTLSGPRTKAIFTPGRMVRGSTAKSAPRCLSSA